MTDDNETQAYKDLVEKYRVKKTTDDCYTPQNVYDAVLKWACEEYGFDPSVAVRPFWPGGDYVSFRYTDGCVVVDNPPFSILSQIIRFYNRVGIRYFLFAPTLTCFNAGRDTCNYVISDVTITYANGARIPTSFVTNLGDYSIDCNIALGALLKAENEKNTRKPERNLRRRFYPHSVLTSVELQKFARNGIGFKVEKGEIKHISHVGLCRTNIFGGGLLLTEKAAAEAEKAAAEAEKAAAEAEKAAAEAEKAAAEAEKAAAEAEKAAAEAEKAAAEYIVLSDADKALQKAIGQKPEFEQGEFAL